MSGEPVPSIAILGPGGVGGLIAGALQRAGNDVLVVGRESTAARISDAGLRVSSVQLGDFIVHPRAISRLEEPVPTLIVATKAPGLADSLGRIAAQPALVMPLLNGLDHLEELRRRFGQRTVAAGTIRVEADRPEPGVVVQTSPFLYVETASANQALQAPLEVLVRQLEQAGVPAGVGSSEAQVMWSKLVRLNALACVTSAFDKLLGEIRSTPELYDEFRSAIEEACTVAGFEGADIDPAQAIAEFDLAHATLGSSMQRDIAAGRVPELDAIPGAVLRAGARHGVQCPTIERLTETIAKRAGLPASGVTEPAAP
jgi:2-dehydropantoate 2-reductase